AKGAILGSVHAPPYHNQGSLSLGDKLGKPSSLCQNIKLLVCAFEFISISKVFTMHLAHDTSTTLERKV
ncbi:MAG: hypothetical protein M0P41_10560, partial [Sphaerochaeta sp.]|nr:hypothetical protein [Sphaerochaeta sp.]